MTGVGSSGPGSPLVAIFNTLPVWACPRQVGRTTLAALPSISARRRMAKDRSQIDRCSVN